MPSLYESWGRVAIEAFASGIPVIAHPTPGLVESLGDAGIFAYRDDLGAWIHALHALKDPANWTQASLRVRARSIELSAAPISTSGATPSKACGTPAPAPAPANGPSAASGVGDQPAQPPTAYTIRSSLTPTAGPLTIQ
ncbi:glycosyltransferase [Streptomyces pseudogriseolus]|uniref:glycosyltransferase n=1 Tax=Streptomyces pseudogriseolus TaxID=36817 RepID=UPI003FA1B40F